MGLEKADRDLILTTVLVVFYILECLFPYFDTFGNKWRHAFRNLFIIGVNAVIINFSLLPLIRYSTDTSWGLFNAVDLDWGLELAATVILIDVLTYVMHVLFHRIPILWRFHRMHHSDTEMDVTSGSRFHIGEHAISISVRCELYALFAMKLENVVLYEAVFLANVLFHHANVSVGEQLDRIYRVFLTSPNMHKVHHSDLKIETDSNYTSLFSLWDRLFGTFRIVRNPKDIKYGIKGLENQQTITGMLLTPFKDLDTS